MLAQMPREHYRKSKIKVFIVQRWILWWRWQKNLHINIVSTFMCGTHVSVWDPLLKKKKKSRHNLNVKFFCYLHHRSHLVQNLQPYLRDKQYLCFLFFLVQTLLAEDIPSPLPYPFPSSSSLSIPSPSVFCFLSSLRSYLWMVVLRKGRVKDNDDATMVANTREDDGCKGWLRSDEQPRRCLAPFFKKIK